MYKNWKLLWSFYIINYFIGYFEEKELKEIKFLETVKRFKNI